MDIKLNKSKFSRNHNREKEFGGFFYKTSKGLSRVFQILIDFIFTPALMTSSLFSKEIILNFANIFLTLGYLTHFFYSIYKNEVCKIELFLVFFALTALFVAAWPLFPAVSTWTLLNVITLFNQLAVVINTFFLIRNIIVPPIIRVIEIISQKLGFKFFDLYYYRLDLTMDNDEEAINRALEKSYSKPLTPDVMDKALDNINNLLKKLILYVNKYDEKFFGYIRNKDKILNLEDAINKLTVKGDTDSSYNFINGKISFKTTKIKRLQKAQIAVQHAIGGSDNDRYNALSFFQTSLLNSNQEIKEKLDLGLSTLESEIKRQQSKIHALQRCLPVSSK